MSATQPDSQTALPMPTPAQQPVAAPASQATPAKAAPATKAKAPPKEPVTNKPAVTARKPAIDIAPKTPTKPVAKSIAKPTPKPTPIATPKPIAEKLPKAKKPKLVRDSFTIPKPEYLVLEELKARAIALTYPVKKTELIRAGIKALAAMADAGFLVALKAVPVIKTGRPTKD